MRFPEFCCRGRAVSLADMGVTNLCSHVAGRVVLGKFNFSDYRVYQELQHYFRLADHPHQNHILYFLQTRFWPVTVTPPVTRRSQWLVQNKFEVYLQEASG